MKMWLVMKMAVKLLFFNEENGCIYISALSNRGYKAAS
jgi:hypothetical protein